MPYSICLFLESVSACLSVCLPACLSRMSVCLLSQSFLYIFLYVATFSSLFSLLIDCSRWITELTSTHIFDEMMMSSTGPQCELSTVSFHWVLGILTSLPYYPSVCISVSLYIFTFSPSFCVSLSLSAQIVINKLIGKYSCCVMSDFGDADS